MSPLDGDPWLALSGELSPSSEEPPITHGEHTGLSLPFCSLVRLSYGARSSCRRFPAVSFITQKSSIQKSFKPSGKKKNP